MEEPNQGSPPPDMSLPSIELDAERRRQMMAMVNYIEVAEDREGPEWEYGEHGVVYHEDEDLLNVEISEKYKDIVTDPNGHRMIVQDIWVDNFKSYKGKHQLGPLHKNLTMIVGPNGSGKSNVIDALLFVFGFRGNKIRTRKLTSLIHSSTHCDYCNVEIHFQMIKDIDEEKYQVIPDSAFTISRSVTRDGKEGTSVYKINENACSQKDVTDLLLRAGIDLTHNRFLILQGEVEAIALMKPTTRNPNEEGMLEYIEDIVGTNRYVIPIAKLAHRVAHYEFRASRFQAGLRKMEGMQPPFEKSMEGCCEYINAKNSLTHLRSVNLKNNLYKAEVTLQNAKEQLEERQDEVDRQEEVRKEAYEEIKRVEEKYEHCELWMEDVFDRKAQKEQEIIEWNARDTRRKANYKQCMGELMDLMKEKELAQKELDEALEAPTKARDKLGAMTVELEQLKAQEERSRRVATDGLIKFDAKSKDEQTKRDRLAEQYGKTNGDCIRVETELKVVENEVRDMKVTAGHDEARLANIEKALEEATRSYERDQGEIEKLTRLRDEAQAKVDQANQQLGGLRSTEMAFRTRRNNLQRQIEELDHQEEQITYRHHATAVLARLRDSGEFPGFIGRVGDLARCDKKLDAMISTIFPQLDWHVVRTNEDCKKGIELLHAHRVSKTSFFFLEHIEYYHLEGMDASPNKFPAPRLFDHIQYDSEDARKVYYYFLGDILFVDTLSDAIALDKKLKGTQKILSLDASFVDRTGNLTGGGRPITNRIRTDSRPMPTTNNSEKRKQLKATLARIRNDFTRVEGELKANDAILAEFEPKIAQYNERLRELEPYMPEQKRQIDSLQESLRRQKEFMSEPSIHVTEQDLEDRREIMEVLIVRVGELRASRNKAKSELEASQKKLDKMFNDLVQKNKDVAEKAKARVEKLEKDMAKEQAVIQNSPQHIEAAKKKFGELQQLFLEKRVETDALGSLEGEAGSKSLIQLTKHLELICQEAESSREKMIKLQKLKTERDAWYQEIVDQLNTYKSQVTEISDMIDHIELQTDRDTRALEALDGQWLEPEDLDPHTKFVRPEEDDLMGKLTAGAILLPPVVLQLCENYRQKAEETPIQEFSPSYMVRVADEIVGLEKLVERYRREFDEKGISQYATFQSLYYNEMSCYDRFFQKMTAHRKKLNELRTARLEEFSEALAFLGTTTQMLYQLITNGGDASLKFVEEGKSSDPFEAGIKFSVRPAKKSWKLIENLSGGEKTLASLCFVFAMHHFRATPLYVMDEIDAALDLNNVRLIANYIKHSERTRNAQFVIISLRNQMFEVGNRLVGIYKVDGCTHNVVVAPVQVEHGNRGLKKILDDKIKEEDKKRKEAADADEEAMLSSGIQNVQISVKRRRKLARINLADFGINDDEDDDDENEEPAGSIARGVQLYEPGPSSNTRETTVSDDFSDEDDEPVRRKRRTVVEDDETEEELEEPSPSPPPPPKMVRGGRRAKK